MADGDAYYAKWLPTLDDSLILAWIDGLYRNGKHRKEGMENTENCEPTELLAGS